MITEEDSRGLELHAGDESVFEFACYDDAGDDQLEAWAKADKEIEMVVAGKQENVLWYEPATIQIIKPHGFATKNRNYRRIRISKSGGVHKVGRGVNLIDIANRIDGHLSAYDISDGNLMKGFTVVTQGSAQANANISGGGIQELEIVTQGTNTYIRKYMIFPVAGLVVTLSEGKIGNVADSTRLSAEDFSSVNLINDSIATSETGRRDVSITTPANTFRLQLNLVRDFSSPVGAVHLTNKPALRTDGSSLYVEY
jgi:hypothetical protein